LAGSLNAPTKWLLLLEGGARAQGAGLLVLLFWLRERGSEGAGENDDATNRRRTTVDRPTDGRTTTNPLTREAALRPGRALVRALSSGPRVSIAIAVWGRRKESS
jgi:hypothetical protein